MDRSTEFFQAVDSFATSRLLASSTTSSRHETDSSASGGQLSVEELQMTALIGDLSRDLNTCGLKLAELSQLVKQRGLFNDRSAQIEHLSHDVKTYITDMNGKLEMLERKTGGSGGSRQTAAHYNNIADTLKNRLLQTTAQFKQLLQQRTESMRNQESRRNMYSSSSTAYRRGGAHPSFMSEQGGGEMERGGGEEQAMVQRVQYSQERAEGMENVQRMIGELGQIFQKVASMVTQQEELVQRIDEDVDTSLHNVNQGQTELLNYFHRISSNRSLILKVFAILVAFVIFFVVFLT
eukprot:GHVS01015367.1.p1 GENE.GHVS01015367.1~~GHVS01015367.1.p1  ORF type:complete len:294 (+),score=61.69 GHVS01015367.1:351-1232(+)